MKPIVIRSLGGVAPFRPRADAGTNVGATRAAPTALAVCRKKWRRLTLELANAPLRARSFSTWPLSHRQRCRAGGNAVRVHHLHGPGASRDTDVDQRQNSRAVDEGDLPATQGCGGSARIAHDCS